VADARFPVHVGIDPTRSKADSVVARLNGYFVVGAHLPRQQWLHFGERMLYLRLNRLGGPGAGSGAFWARVQVWSDKSPLQAFRYVSCVRRDSSDPDRRIDGLGGVERDGTKWSMDIDDVLAAMDHAARPPTWWRRSRTASPATTSSISSSWRPSVRSTRCASS